LSVEVVKGLSMSDISDLEQRLAAALRRISTATEALPKAVIIGSSSSSIDPTRAANQKSHAVTLAEVRSSLAAATSKLTVQEEKIEMLVQALENTRENQVSPVGAEDSQNNFLADAFSELEVELSQLAQSNTQLREANQNLRDSNAKGLGDAGLINSGLQSGIDSLSAERAADKAHLQVLITALSEAASIDVTEEKENA
jgi:DNA repair exonuclease SbcCD ATPase subunit